MDNQNTQDQETNQLQASSKPYLSTSPSVSSFEPTPTLQPIQPKPRKKIVIALCLLFILLLLLGGAFAFKSLNKSTATSTSQPTQSTQPTGSSPTALEKKLNQQQIDQLHAIKMPLYIPKGMPIQNPILSYVKSTNKTQLIYGVNIQYGQGPLKGSYSFSIYPVSSTFKPPTDCGLTNGKSASSPLACSEYKQTDKNISTYIYNGNNPLGITNTSGQQQITMYAKKGEVVIAVSTAATDPSELFNIIKNMQQIKPAELPSSTMTNFLDRE